MGKNNGLYGYIISRADGTPVEPENEYFVLKVAGKGDEKHLEACRKSVLFYANEIAEHLPELSKDLINRYGK